MQGFLFCFVLLWRGRRLEAFDRYRNQGTERDLLRTVELIIELIPCAHLSL